MADGPVVTVRGEAYREVPPELARFTVTVTARDRDRETTLTKLAERAAAVRVLLDGSAVDRRETGDLRVRPETRRATERVVAWHGAVTTTVTVSDFTALGELMLRLADQDQVEVAGPWWSLRPDSPAYREARHAAITDALARAREYAEALGARVTALLELADTGSERPMMARMAYAGGPEGGTPELDLDPQPQPVHAAVQARFAISEPVLG